MLTMRAGAQDKIAITPTNFAGASPPTEQQWQGGLKESKKYYIDSLAAPYVTDIELKFDGSETNSARFSGEEGERVIFINPSFAKRFKNSLRFVLGHELAHDVFNHTRPAHNAQMDVAYEAGDDLEFDRLSRIREQFCDSLAVVASSADEAILYFDRHKLEEYKEVREVLTKAIPSLESMTLEKNSLIKVTLPLKECLPCKGETPAEQSILSAFKILVEQKYEAPKLKVVEVPLDKIADEVANFIALMEKYSGSHGSYLGRQEAALGKR